MESVVTFSEVSYALILNPSSLSLGKQSEVKMWRLQFPATLQNPFPFPARNTGIFFSFMHYKIQLGLLEVRLSELWGSPPHSRCSGSNYQMHPLWARNIPAAGCWGSPAAAGSEFLPGYLGFSIFLCLPLQFWGQPSVLWLHFSDGAVKNCGCFSLLCFSYLTEWSDSFQAWAGNQKSF